MDATCAAATAEPRRAWVAVLVAIVLAIVGGTVPSARASGGIHGDDFAGQREVAAPPEFAAQARAQVAAAHGRALAPGPRQVAVVLLNFASAPSTPFTVDAVRSAIFTGASSVNAFEQEQSDGAISLTGKLATDGDIFGWYTIDGDTTLCDPDAWMAAADAAAATAGVSLAGYQHYIYLFPKVSACGWAGMAEMPGNLSFINGTLSVRVIAHELGHNLGSHHASTLSCVDGSGSRVTFSSTCTLSEYGDPFDVMGASDRQSDAFRKVDYGLIPFSGTQTVTSSGTYTLTTASLLGPGVRSLRVQRGASSEYWYMELRSTTGQYDDFPMGDPAVTGVSVRLATGYGTGVRTKLIDGQPTTLTFADAPLQVGQTFTDPSSGVAMTVVSAGGGAASVQVAFPLAPPSATPAPSPPPTTPTPASTPPPPSVPPTTAVPTVSAAVRLNRTSARSAAVRVSFAAPGARSCSVRIGVAAWASCRIVGGRAAVARTVAIAGRSLAVRVRIDGQLRLVTTVRVPRVGGVTYLVAPLRSL